MAASRLKADPMAVLALDRRSAIKMSSDVGVSKMRRVLKRAQSDLKRRLFEAEGLSVIAGRPTFTEAQVRATLAQIEQVLKGVEGGIKTTVVEQGTASADLAAETTVEYLNRAERRFKGVGTQPLAIKEAAILDRARSGTESSILHRLLSDPADPRRIGILERYGTNVVKRFEETLQQRFLARKPWADVRNELVAESPFLQQAPAFWAERIVRTEVMAAHGRAAWEATREANVQLGDVVKILMATFDDRTGADSVAVHGQIRRPEQAFEWWDGLYQNPPNRPNDREIVVAHRISWPIPESLEWKTDAEVALRWHENGRKGSPPPRPKMTTVPVESFGAA